MSNSKKQSIFVIGIAMMIIAFVMLFFALNQPKLALEEYASSSGSTSNQSSSVSNDISSNDAVSSYSEPVSFPVNINTCTFEELLSVNGIGEAKASAIIEYRNVIGEYTSLEQIKNISGIGDGVYNQIAPYLCV